jgi:hypothetical protein|tara:strand:- start:1668 stop:1883 length:216 start_codon:yes stop_codon:yes gene_type:complete
MDFHGNEKQKRNRTLNIEEKIADLLYALAEIRRQTDDERIQIMTEAMEATVMEMDVLVQSEGGKSTPNLSF